MNKPFYEKNLILEDLTVNVTFDDLLRMSPKQFEDWVIHCRKMFLKNWDENGCPPKTGKNEEQIIDEFNKLTSAPISKFTQDDELTPNEKGTVIQNTIYYGAEVDQFFPNMMKTKMVYGKDTSKGVSVYDLFADDKFLPKMIKSSFRHFKRDSFYHYSQCAKRNDGDVALFNATSGVEWIKTFLKNEKTEFSDYSFWISESEKEEEISTAYRQILQSDLLSVTRDELLELNASHSFPVGALSNIDMGALKPNCVYLIRVYKKGQRIYPKGFIAYRIGYVSIPVNFPACTAKYLYEKYSNHLVEKGEEIVVYDASAGWAGRILGAMSVRDDRKLVYAGTDPNTENVHADGRTKYEHVAEFFNTKTYRGTSPFSHTNRYEIFQLGSEVIGAEPKFQKYKGKVDIAFTSPPYLCRELYSDDPTQAGIKYGSSYDAYRDGFLKPTLQTCFEWLKPGGYILWNIADILVDGEYLPLEKDSCDYLRSLGMTFTEKLKMTLQSMSGSQRLNADGTPKCKNFCKVNGRFMKYEPIFVFRKKE